MRQTSATGATKSSDIRADGHSATTTGLRGQETGGENHPVSKPGPDVHHRMVSQQFSDTREPGTDPDTPHESDKVDGEERVLLHEPETSSQSNMGERIEQGQEAVVYEDMAEPGGIEHPASDDGFESGFEETFEPQVTTLHGKAHAGHEAYVDAPAGNAPQPVPAVDSTATVDETPQVSPEQVETELGQSVPRRSQVDDAPQARQGTAPAHAAVAVDSKHLVGEARSVQAAVPIQHIESPQAAGQGRRAEGITVDAVTRLSPPPAWAGREPATPGRHDDVPPSPSVEAVDPPVPQERHTVVGRQRVGRADPAGAGAVEARGAGRQHQTGPASTPVSTQTAPGGHETSITGHTVVQRAVPPSRQSSPGQATPTSHGQRRPEPRPEPRAVQAQGEPSAPRQAGDLWPQREALVRQARAEAGRAAAANTARRPTPTPGRERTGPEVFIGQIDVYVDAPSPAPARSRTSTPAPKDVSSKYYLRGL